MRDGAVRPAKQRRVPRCPPHHFPLCPTWRGRCWGAGGDLAASREPPPNSLTFRTRFFRMLSTANTCSPMADSSMRGGGRRAGGRVGSGVELRGRGCCARCSGRRGPRQALSGAHAHARTPPSAPSRRRRSIFEPAQRFPQRRRAGARARAGLGERPEGQLRPSPPGPRPSP